MLTRYWSLSEHGQLKGLATKHTTIKWPFTNKQAQKQTENKSLTQIFDIFQLFTGHRQNNIGTARLKRGYLREGHGNKVHTLLILVLFVSHLTTNL